ncbi:MAG: response regulator [Candidatus Anammoxibacter sp.]
MAKKKHGLLFVDDEEDIINTLYDIFIDDYNVFKTVSPKEALEIVKKEDIAVIISDQRMPEMTGTELLEAIYNVKPETIRILLTGYADVTAAVDAINKGAVHKYVEKPWNDDDLMEMVKGLVEIYEESNEKLGMLSKVEDIITNEISFRGILDNIKEGACAMSEDGNIFFANTKALGILGYSTNDEIKSKKVFDISADDLEEFKTEFKAKKKVKGKIITAAGKDDDQLDVLLTPVFDKKDERIVGVIFQGI